jgi:hypothetical protein
MQRSSGMFVSTHQTLGFSTSLAVSQPSLYAEPVAWELQVDTSTPSVSPDKESSFTAAAAQFTGSQTKGQSSLAPPSLYNAADAMLSAKQDLKEHSDSKIEQTIVLQPQELCQEQIQPTTSMQVQQRCSSQVS